VERDDIKHDVGCPGYYQTFICPPTDTGFQNLADDENRSQH